MISIANYILAGDDEGLKIQKLKDGNEGRRGERSQETKEDEDAENEVAETEDSGEKEAHKEEKTPRDRLHKSKGRIFNQKSRQFAHQSGQLKPRELNSWKKCKNGNTYKKYPGYKN